MRFFFPFSSPMTLVYFGVFPPPCVLLAPRAIWLSYNVDSGKSGLCPPSTWYNLCFHTLAAKQPINKSLPLSCLYDHQQYCFHLVDDLILKLIRSLQALCFVGVVLYVIGGFFYIFFMCKWLGTKLMENGRPLCNPQICIPFHEYIVILN